jgi:hypothetical protein
MNSSNQFNVFGFFASLISGWLAIKLLLYILKKTNFSKKSGENTSRRGLEYVAKKQIARSND